jgi:MoaA/NifB/PqqE/SkfB family radical SAM enzyme
MLLSKEVIERYNASRFNTDKSVVCHAPYVNLNFEQNGNVRACCYNSKHILGTWPLQKIKDMWQGKAAQELRDYITDNNLGGGCKECGNMLVSENFQGVRARYYDEYAKSDVSSKVQKWYSKLTGAMQYPRVMEFELSNECNLECVMCNGYFSSSIRKNREHLPPINSVYDDRFVDELEEFIPHLTDAKFLGGEPFMIDIYLKIWERILKIKPDIRIHITTNATFLNRRIKDLLEGLNAGIILSIDSVDPETYKKIRVNGNYQKVMENLEYFRDYTKRKKTFISLAACPITYNWHELPQLLTFCIEKNIALYFNAVFSPSEFSLRDQPIEYLENVINVPDTHPLPARSGGASSPTNLSINAYVDFVKLLKGWLAERKEEANANAENKGYSHIDNVFIKEEIENWTLDEIREKLKAFVSVDGMGYIDKETVLLNRISNLFLATPAGRLNEVIGCYFDIYSTTQQIDMTAAKEKATNIAALIEGHPKRNDILLMMSKASPLKLAEGFYMMDMEQLTSQLQQAFNN